MTLGKPLILSFEFLVLCIVERSNFWRDEHLLGVLYVAGFVLNTYLMSQAAITKYNRPGHLMDMYFS